MIDDGGSLFLKLFWAIKKYRIRILLSYLLRELINSEKQK